MKGCSLICCLICFVLEQICKSIHRVLLDTATEVVSPIMEDPQDEMPGVGSEDRVLASQRKCIQLHIVSYVMYLFVMVSSCRPVERPWQESVLKFLQRAPR